jgi:2-dehydro-3-deoxygluconokinase
MSKILTFGEPILINYISCNNTKDFSDSYFSLGGSEINTSVALKNLGCEPYLLSCIPKNFLGKYYLDNLIKKCLNTDLLMESNEDLIASMYIKNGDVFYQRKYSAFYFLKKSDIDFNRVFSIEYDWLHLTGITPLLSETVKDIWVYLLEKCIELRIPISIDLNYRPKLGNFKDLWLIIRKYISDINTLIVSEGNIIDICMHENIVYSNFIDNNLKEISKKMNINKLVICLKERENGIQKRYSILVYNNELYYSNIKKHIPLEDIGGGDSYIACLIDQLLNNPGNIKENLDFSDIYTILNQNNIGNFSIVGKKELDLNKNKDIFI